MTDTIRTTEAGQVEGRPWTQAEALGARALYARSHLSTAVEWDKLADHFRELYLADARTVLDAAGARLIDQVADQAAELVQDLRDVALSWAGK